MNRAAANITKCLVGLISLLLAACNTNSPTEPPQLTLVGAISTTQPPTSTPVVTLTPTPTPFPSRTPIPTPRRVVVSRISPEINPAQITPMAEGARLPDLTLTDIEGNVINLSEIGKPLALNFWSVGCGSCFFEFPLLQEFYAYHGENSLVVIGVNIADFSDETRIIAEQLEIQFPVVIDANAEFFTTYFNGAVVPTTIFITSEGIISEVVIGPIDAYNLDLQLQKIGLPPRERRG